MNKIYITGDIHGDPFRFSTDNFKEGKNLTKDDYVIIAGDFGIIWTGEPDKNEEHKIQWLKDKPWTTLFVDGNHENHYRLGLLPEEEKFGGKVGVVADGVYHLKRGELYEIGGKTFFCFGGAISWDRYHRTLGISYWDEEIPSNKEMDYGLSQMESVDYKVDYIITHTLPKSLIQVLGFTKSPPEKEDVTTKFLDHIANSATFDKWYFGHMHVDKDLGKFKALYYDIDQITE